MVADDVASWVLPPAEFDAVRAALARVRGGLLAGPDERVEHLEALIDWLNDDARLPVPAAAAVPSGSQAARLWALTHHLQRYTDDARALGDVVGAVLLHASALPFFAKTGLPAEARLFSEVFDRVARKLLPTPADDGDLAAVLRRSLSRRDFLVEAPASVVVGFVALLDQHSPAFGQGLEKLERDARDAVSVLAVRVANVGVGVDVRARAGAVSDLADYPFLDLPRWCDLVLERRQSDEELRERISGTRQCLRACHGLLRKVHDTLLKGSVSVDLVFRLDLAERQVSRLDRLLDLVDPGKEERPALALQTLLELLDAGADDTSLKGVFNENTRLLARRIVEATGSAGEHYIASSSSEYRAMWKSAALGGAFMAVVCITKFLLTWTKLPPFFSGLSHGLNYAGAFVFMQVFHMTLATKQPSATAATLAAALDEHGRSGVHRLVDLIGRTARTQVAAIGGNIGAIVPAAIALHFAVLAVKGAPFLDSKDGHHALEAHHLLHSGTPLFAALTGVYLWLSSIVAGWTDNWLRFRRLPEAFATNRRIKRVLGVNAALRLSTLVEHSAGPAVGNVFFGLILGLTPVVAGFFGLPAEIRHITLSTATVVFGALSELHRGTLHSADLLWAVAGLASIAFMNFTVSFSLALAVALRARDIDLRVFRLLVLAVLKRYLRRPWELVWPVRDKLPSTTTTPTTPTLPAA